MNTKTKWMIGLMVSTAVGCGLPGEKETPYEFDNIVFTVQNTGTASIWLGPQFALKILHGEDEYVPLQSGQCNFGPSSGGRSIAGAPSQDAAPAPSRTELRPGNPWVYSWNARVLGDGTECPDLQHLLGEELIAEFCYGTNIEGPDTFNGAITGIECARQPFVMAEGQAVDIDIDHTVELDETIPVIVENQGAGSIFVQMSANCGADTFYSVTFGSEVIGPQSQCGLCDCSEGAECVMACDLSCAAPEVVELLPGETAQRDFSLTYQRTYNEGDYQCTQTHRVPAGMLTASICYGTDVLEDQSQIGGERCEDVSFTIEDDEVRLVVAP